MSTKYALKYKLHNQKHARYEKEFLNYFYFSPLLIAKSEKKKHAALNIACESCCESWCQWPLFRKWEQKLRVTFHQRSASLLYAFSNENENFLTII